MTGKMSYAYSSVEDSEMDLLLHLPRHDNVVELLGFLLNATCNGGEENLAIILPSYDGGSLKGFVKKRG